MTAIAVSRRWQDSANLVLGAWLLASPWILAYTGTSAAANAYVIGAGLVIFALVAAYVRVWEEIVNMLFGMWLVVSPFALGFSSDTAVALHTVLVGILATAFAIWAMSNDKSFYKRWHSRHSV